MFRIPVKLVGLAVLGVLAAACASPSKEPSTASATPDPDPPLLFASGATYELTADGKPVGFVFADAGAKLNQQTLHWILLGNFTTPVEKEVWVHRLVSSTDGVNAPTTAADFKVFAQKLFVKGTSTWVKSYADTHRILRPVANGTGTRSVIPVPWPEPRDAPKPKGDPPRSGNGSATAPGVTPAGAAAAGAGPADAAGGAGAAAGGPGKFEQLDDGTIGIRPGGPGTGTGTVGGGPTGPGYLDPELLPPQGMIGMAVAGPMLSSNVEYWFLPGKLFKTGLDDTTLGPYRVIGGTIASTPIADWAVVVVSSSYYRNGIPEGE